jgi:type IV secretion system protein VirB10
MSPRAGTLFRTVWGFIRRQPLTPGAEANASAAGMDRPDFSRSKVMASGLRSTQARIGNILGVIVIGCLGLVFLWWYYGHAAQRPATGHARNATAASSDSKTEAALAPLDFSWPASTPNDVNNAQPNPSGSNSAPQGYLIGNVLDDAAVAGATSASNTADDANGWGAVHDATVANARHSPAAAARQQRELESPVFARAPEPMMTTIGASSTTGPTTLTGTGGTPESGKLADLLRTTEAPTAVAKLIGPQHLLLPKGATIDATLITAMDSTLPGLVTCVTATDTYSADGSVMLIERGTTLFGETRSTVQAGSARIFVVWTEARTPAGVNVPLISPGADELGRSGLPGIVNRHFWDRFGAALLISVVDGAIQTAVAAESRGSNGTTVQLDPESGRDVLTEVLRSTVGVPPTVVKRNGDRIQIVVARDVDFSSVYVLQRR